LDDTVPAVLFTCGCVAASGAHATTLHVGPGQAYSTVAAAVAAAKDGDTIDVQAGTYTNDFAEIAHKITLQSVGGMAVLKATLDIPNGKAILITDTDITISGFVLTGAHVTNADGANGAGIRYQGGNLVVQNCWVHNNQEGLLGDALPGTIKIIGSEFDHNGDATGPGAGYTHNIYAGNNDELDIENSYIHHAILGHEIKSRANSTVINHSRVVDGPGSTASYSIDLPNGGLETVTNTIIEQGADSVNGGIVAYGEDGNWNPSLSLTLQDVTLVNDLTQHTPVGVALYAPITASLTHTRVWGLTQAQLTANEGGQGTFDITGTTWLKARPRISGKHPF
jgi:hypothetical protein